MKINILELEIEDIIEEMILSKSDKLPYELDREYIIRQFNLCGYGIVDMLCFDILCINYNNGVRNITIDASIIELKRDILSIETFSQVMRYKKGIIEYSEFLQDKFKKETLITFRKLDVVMIGKCVDRIHECFCYLPDIIDCLKIFTYKISIDGFSLVRECGYNLSEPKFNRNYSIIESALIPKYRFHNTF